MSAGDGVQRDSSSALCSETVSGDNRRVIMCKPAGKLSLYRLCFYYRICNCSFKRMQLSFSRIKSDKYKIIQIVYSASLSSVISEVYGRCVMEVHTGCAI